MHPPRMPWSPGWGSLAVGLALVLVGSGLFPVAAASLPEHVVGGLSLAGHATRVVLDRSLAYVAAETLASTAKSLAKLMPTSVLSHHTPPPCSPVAAKPSVER